MEFYFSMKNTLFFYKAFEINTHYNLQTKYFSRFYVYQAQVQVHSCKTTYSTGKKKQHFLLSSICLLFISNFYYTFHFVFSFTLIYSLRSLQQVVCWLIRRKARVQAPGPRHQNKIQKKYFFGDFLSADFWQKL